MSKVTKTFRSGNSVAVRLPSSLGVAPGIEMRVREERGRYVIEPVAAAKRKFNIAKVAGSARDLQFIRDEDRLFEERPLLWEQPPATARANEE
jgi:antitoxin VapB